MTRIVGFVLGGLMLANSITDTLFPRYGFNFWQRNLRPHLPSSVNSVVSEFSQVSIPTRRYITFWEMGVALLTLWLASQIHK